MSFLCCIFPFRIFKKREDKDSKASIEDDIAAELSELKESKDKVRRFQKVKTDVAGNFFVTTTVDDPGRLVTTIFEDLKAKHEQRSRFIQRLLPVQTTCKAHLDTYEEDGRDCTRIIRRLCLARGRLLGRWKNPSQQQPSAQLDASGDSAGGKECQAFVDGGTAQARLGAHDRRVAEHLLHLPDASMTVKARKRILKEKAACEENKKPSVTAKDDTTDVAQAAESKPESSSSNGGSTDLSTNPSEEENVGSHKTEETSKD
ncbi:hypothetical protein MTO96_038172 [Rhipicephalus appendiculatus]